METFDGQSMILPYGGDGASMPAVPFNISPVEFDNADGAQHETSSIADSSALPTPSTASSEVPTQDSGADQKSLENKDYSDQSDNVITKSIEDCRSEDTVFIHYRFWQISTV